MANLLKPRVFQPKCYGHYVTGEYIGTTEWLLKFRTLRQVIKQVRGVRSVLLATNRLITLAMGTLQALPDLQLLIFKFSTIMVYVQNKEGKPLMPTQRHGKVRRMLRDGLAVVVQMEPFTIRLTYDTTEYVQPISLGIDAGSKHVGVSATTSKKELYAAEVDLGTDIKKSLSTRRSLRRNRRNRLRYRPARFLNHRRPQGWLPPSIENKIMTHLLVIGNVFKILPITDVVIEVAQFDIQKIKNPEISGAQYQQGEQMGFWNVREYVLACDGHECQYCHENQFRKKDGEERKEPKKIILNVHHLESRKTGGNAPNNLITLCEKCHKKLHSGKIELNIERGASLKDPAAMNIMRWALYKRAKDLFPNVKLTYGYITKSIRIQHGLEKSHIVDARCISGNPNARPCHEYHLQKKVRCHTRQLYKMNTQKGGIRKRNTGSFESMGFRKFDKVKYRGITCHIVGLRKSGFFAIRSNDGRINLNSVKFTELKLIERRKTLLSERMTAIPPTH